MTGTCRMLSMSRILPIVLNALAIAGGMLPIAGAAEEELTWYAIEIIVFERTSEIGRNAEVWTSEPGLPNLADAIELTVEGLAPEELGGGATVGSGDAAASQPTSVLKPLLSMPRPFQLIPAEQYRLADAWNRLEKSSAYRPLLHIGWIQPGYPTEEARLVHVRNANAALGAVTTNLGEAAAAPRLGNRSGISPTFAPRITIARDPSRAALDGTVRVHRARYLHVEADLLYYRPVDGDARATPPATNVTGTGLVVDSPENALIEQLLIEDDRVPRLFRLTERRRMRSRELHYLDHPLFGLLVEAWPLELPETPAATLPPETAPPVESAAPGKKSDAAKPAQGQSGSGG